MSLQASKQFMEQNDHFLVVSHVQPDGDAASSTCAVGLMLTALNKRFVMMNEEKLPTKFNYLAGYEQVKIYNELSPEEQVETKYKYVIAVDCADFSRIGRVSELFAPDVQILNIDHHATNNFYGTVNLIDEQAAATAEVLYNLLLHLNMPLNSQLAHCFYTGLLTDTGGFRYANTTAQVMQIAAHLLQHEVDANDLADRLLEKVTMGHVELLRKALNRLSFAYDNKVCWLSITLEDMELCAATNEDLEGIVNYPRNIMGVEVGIFFRELANNKVKASFRSLGAVDVAAFAATYGGGGHKLAAGATIEGTLPEVIAQVTASLEHILP